jgi:hypothetical protein
LKPMGEDRMKETGLPDLSRRRVLLLLAAVWIAAIAVRVALFTGYMNGDMGNYIQEAHNFWEGTYSVANALAHQKLDALKPGPDFNWQNLRLGLIVPVGLLMKTFGVSEASYAIFTFFWFTIGLLVTYAFGRRLHSALYGVLAAVIYAFVSVEISLSTILTPHQPAAVLLALSCYCLFCGLEGDRRKVGGKILALLSGGAVGAAYLMYEVCAVFLPILGILLLWGMSRKGLLRERYPWVLGLLVIAGFGVVFAGEQLYFYRMSGVWLLRGKFISSMMPKWLELNPRDLGLTGLGIYPKAMLASYLFGSFFYLALLGLLVEGIRYIRHTEERGRLGRLAFVPGVWACLMFLYLEFGSSSIGEYRPVFKLPHYLVLITIPASLLAAAFFVELYRKVRGELRLGSRRISLGLLACVTVLAGYIGSSVLCAWVNFIGNGGFRPDVTNEHRIKAAVDKVERNGPIYTDSWTKNGLDFVYGYKRDIQSFDPMNGAGKELSEVRDGIVVANWLFLNSGSRMSDAVPEIFKSPPSNWKMVGRVKGNVNSIKIYRIEATNGG